MFAGRRQEMARLRQWVQAARASTETKPTVVVLHGAPGSGRTTLAVRAVHELRDYFRGACLVDLPAARGGRSAAGGSSAGSEAPLSTRDALLHLLNRLGAPREQLLFRERSSADQQVKRLSELYHQHLTGVPVTVVLDDASDPEQVRTLVPERSDSLVLVTAREPLRLPPDLPARVYDLPVEELDAAGAEELLGAAAEDASGPYDAESSELIRQLCGGLPLALRVAGSSLGPRSPRALATDLGAYGPVEPVERALWLRYNDQPEQARRLLRRLALAGRTSLGAAAAAALMATDEAEATRQLTALSRAGLIDHVRGSRYRLHDVVRAFARARLADEEEPADRTAAQERLIANYAELADSVLRLVDGNMSTRSNQFGQYGFTSLDEALRWLDDESSFITATLRHAEGVDQGAVLNLLGALCDYCLLRGDLYRLGEISELAQSVDQGLLVRSVQWRTGIAARQLGELDKARTTLASVVDLYRDAHHDAGAARALCSLGITLHHQGNLTDAAAKLREALDLQAAPELATDRAWTLHALGGGAARPGPAGRGPGAAHRVTGAAPGGRVGARPGVGPLPARPAAPADGRRAGRGVGSAGRPGPVRPYPGRPRRGLGADPAGAGPAGGRDVPAAVEGLRRAETRHRENADARGKAWSIYYLGQALEETGA
ncbi:Tetratricopeptide repeat protein OS=Streptomyces tendae OX=1932 GN=GUR47_15925 PE=4 SV=1 [Streptomyces tendae]